MARSLRHAEGAELVGIDDHPGSLDILSLFPPPPTDRNPLTNHTTSSYSRVIRASSWVLVQARYTHARGGVTLGRTSARMVGLGGLPADPSRPTTPLSHYPTIHHPTVPPILPPPPPPPPSTPHPATTMPPIPPFSPPHPSCSRRPVSHARVEYYERYELQAGHAGVRLRWG